MSSLSLLPGRIRLEHKPLIGDIHRCSIMQDAINGIYGVTHAYVNYRTGRILIEYDQNITKTDSLINETDAIIGSFNSRGTCNTVKTSYSAGQETTIMRKMPKKTADLANVLFAVAAKSLLPKPLDVILPLALKVANAVG
ncbi:MAG: hypothetical protein HQL06_13765 [Nitrospirae bacterium]|nr:hypothetical protein [Nitrospirota bacterium]